MYHLDVKPDADKIFRKLAKKNPQRTLMIGKKLEDIRNNPAHTYKFLRAPLQNFNRVHIDKHFVLIFKIVHENKSVEVYYFSHHDEVYDWRPDL